MSEFKGNNFFESIHDQVIDKSLFQTRGHQTEGPEVFEFNFLEYSMYGTVNNEGTSIYPNESKIIRFKKDFRQYYSHQGFDFLTQMFLDVKRNVQLAIQLGHLQNDNGPIANMNIVRGYENPKDLYLKYLKEILLRYNLQILENRALNDNITSFRHYVKHLMDFFTENYFGQPLTFSGWLQSSDNSIFSTGLALSIADISFSDDDQKYTEFMDTPLFSFYKRAALNRGFRVWKHCPYVMVADLASPAIQNYIPGNVEDTLDEYYSKSYNIDYKYLYNSIIEFYNYFVFESPYVIELKLGCVKRTGKEFRYRQEQSYANIDEPYWIDFYIDLRNLETGGPKGRSEIKKIKKNTKFFINSLDNSKALGYIDNVFKEETFKKSFGLAFEHKRMLDRQRQERIREGITGGSTIGVPEIEEDTSGGY